MTIYTTSECEGFGKQDYYWNEYRVEYDEVTKVRCHRQRPFEGDESTWSRDEEEIDSWKIDDPKLPEWLREHLKD